MSDRGSTDNRVAGGGLFGFFGGENAKNRRNKSVLEVQTSWGPSWKNLFVLGGSVVTVYLFYKWYWPTKPDTDRTPKQRTASHRRTYSSPRPMEMLDSSEESYEEKSEEEKDVVYYADPDYIPNIVSKEKANKVRNNDAQFSNIFNHIMSTTTSVKSSGHSEPCTDTGVFENQNSKSVTPNVAEMGNQNEPPNEYVVRTVVTGSTTLENLKERYGMGNIPKALQENRDNKKFPLSPGLSPEGSSLENNIKEA